MPSGKIKSLSPDTINKIAAGEVVERPASVIKELVENSLDADAGKIVVHIEEGGKSLIKISDDGSGIPKSEIPLLWKRHATSKIEKVEDLFKISSMGFRGEALSSIASVAEMVIESKHADDDTGFKVRATEGRSNQIEEISKGKGTTITVKNLFHNIPVRKKFLNSAKSESGMIVKTITRLALGNPHISFILTDSRGELFSCQASTSRERAGIIFGSSVQEELIQIDYTQGEMKIEGYIGTPDHFRGNRMFQYYYVNGRFVQSIFLSKALATGYDLKIDGKYPIGFLNISLPYHEVDVNVHPTKKEVRFLSEKQIFSFIVAAVRHSLINAFQAPLIKKSESDEITAEVKEGMAPSFTFDPPIYNVEGEQSFEKAQTQLLLKDPEPEVESEKILSWPGNKKDSPETEEEDNNKTELALNHIPLLQIHRAYILFEVKSGMMVVNQQHAHERILYEQALHVLKSGGKVGSQQLLFPDLLNLGKEEFECVKSNLSKITSLGFDLQEFGSNTFQLRGIPAEISQKKAVKVTKEIFGKLLETEGSDDSGPAILALAYATGSCIKLGESLTLQEMTHLVDRLFATQNPYVSPRGKSVILRYRLEEFHRKFGVKPD